MGGLCLSAGVCGVLLCGLKVVASGVGCREGLPDVGGSVGRSCCGTVKVWCLGWLVDTTHQKAHEAGKWCFDVALERLPQTVLSWSLLEVFCIGAWLPVFVRVACVCLSCVGQVVCMVRLGARLGGGVWLLLVLCAVAASWL